MSNQRLREALSDATVEIEELADALKVDAKTVERWLAGRTPYARHRTRVAKILHVRERDLWPELQPPAQPQDAGHGPETITAYPTPEAPGAPDWRSLITTARERIDLLDESLIEIVSEPGMTDLLAAKGAAGCHVRILITRLDTGWVAEYDEDPDYDINQGHPTDVAINHARRHLNPLINQPGVEIRQLPYWHEAPLLRFDRQILYTPVLLDTARADAPLLHVHQPGALFERLTENFDALWAEVAARVYPGWYDDAEDEDQEPNEDDEPQDDQTDAATELLASPPHHLFEDEPDPLLTRAERDQLHATLTSWGVDQNLIDETLRDAVFGPGLTGLRSDDPNIGQGVAIMINEGNDPKLDSLFKRREHLDDETLLADWQLDEQHTRVLIHPNAPEALIAYTIQLVTPIQLRRTYLMLASKNAQLLSWLAQPGTNLWLIPHKIALREWAKEGAGTGQDIYDHALPLGTVTEPSQGIQAALKHIGYPSN